MTIMGSKLTDNGYHILYSFTNPLKASSLAFSASKTNALAREIPPATQATDIAGGYCNLFFV